MPTQVPNSGYVEKVYFNTSLTKEEVHNILSGLNFANAGAPNGMLIYMPFVNADYSCSIEIDYYPTTNEYTLSYAVGGVALRIFDSTNHDLENGWNTNYFIEAYNVNSENIASSFMAQFGVEMQNDKLINLISTTPFEETIALKPFLKGLADAIREKKKTTELINAQDFRNEILSIQGGGLIEVDALPSEGKENTVYALKKQPTYEIYVNIEGQGVLKLKDIAQQEGAHIELVEVVNSKEKLPSNPIEFTGMEQISVYYVRNDDLYVYGAFGENDTKIWFSFSTLMEMSFSGEVASMDDMTVVNTMYVLSIPNDCYDYYIYEGDEPTQVPNSGLIENLYFNTKLSNEEVDNILSQLTYDTDGYAYVVGAYEKGSSYGNIIIVEANAFTQGQIPSGYIIGHMHDTTNMASTEFIYMSNQGLVDLALTMGINTKVGWNMETLNLNQTFIGHYGTENDKLINVISTTPYPHWTKISGGGATVKATPIAVPNTGFVERIYLNKSLSFDEVNAICTKANSFVANELLKANVIACNKDETKFLAVMMFTDTDNTTFNAILYPDLVTVIWSERDYYHEGTDGSITQWKKGWNIEEDYLEFNDEVVAEANIFTDVTCGTYNDQLTELFSANGTFVSEMKLDGEYDGTTITVTNMTLQGTEIPTTGTIGTVYCNTSMSVEEVVKVLKTLNYETDGSNEFCGVVETLDRLIRIIKTGNVYGILDGVMFVFVSESVASTNFVGWNPEYTTISVNQESTLTDDFVSQNDKLKNILSITPFEEKPQKNFNIDIKSLLEQNKLPLNIKVDAQSLEVYVPIKFEILHIGNVNIDFSNAVFNNPDNVPIYKETTKLEVVDSAYQLKYSFGLKDSSEEISFKTDSGNNGIYYYNRYTSSNTETGVDYFIKLNDLINKETPYLSNVILSQTEGHEGEAVHVTYLQRSLSSKCEAIIGGYYGFTLHRDFGGISLNETTATLNDITLDTNRFTLRYKDNVPEKVITP